MDGYTEELISITRTEGFRDAMEAGYDVVAVVAMNSQTRRLTITFTHKAAPMAGEIMYLLGGNLKSPSDFKPVIQ